MTKEEFLKHPFTANTWAVVNGKEYPVEQIDYTDLDIRTNYGFFNYDEISMLCDKQPEPNEELKEPSEIEMLRKEVIRMRQELDELRGMEPPRTGVDAAAQHTPNVMFQDLLPNTYVKYLGGYMVRLTDKGHRFIGVEFNGNGVFLIEYNSYKGRTTEYEIIPNQLTFE